MVTQSIVLRELVCLYEEFTKIEDADFTLATVSKMLTDYVTKIAHWDPEPTTLSRRKPSTQAPTMRPKSPVLQEKLDKLQGFVSQLASQQRQQQQQYQTRTSPSARMPPPAAWNTEWQGSNASAGLLGSHHSASAAAALSEGLCIACSEAGHQVINCPYLPAFQAMVHDKKIPTQDATQTQASPCRGA